MSENAKPLWKALGICPGDMVAFTGGGGKTALALRVLRELSAAGRPVLFTSTTKLLPLHGIETICIGDHAARWLGEVQAALSTGRRICVVSHQDQATGKMIGLSPEQVGALKQIPDCVILVEADGSAGRPLKVPAPHEPVIPAETNLVVPVAGAGALGAVLGDRLVHRAPLVAALTGLALGAQLTPEAVALALVSPQGCTRGAPPGARIVPVLGQADLPGVLPALRQTARLMLGQQPGGARGLGTVGRVVLAAPATAEPVREVVGDVAAVVLAGGASRRFGGGSKLLHRLGDRTVLEHSLQAPLGAGLREVVVVTGAYHEALAPLLAPYPVRVVANPDWPQGMSTTLKAGVVAVGPEPGAVIICLGDQPYLPAHVVEAVANAFRRGAAPIVAPELDGQRRSPVLFARALFPELLAIEGDEGGRAVVRRYQDQVHTIPADEASWFADIDTRADADIGAHSDGDGDPPVA